MGLLVTIHLTKMYPVPTMYHTLCWAQGKLVNSVDLKSSEGKSCLTSLVV